jgi:RNA polymerase sigma-70 factor (ECF subfamily)
MYAATITGVTKTGGDFEKLANEHKDAVYRQLIRACGNREDAEDVLIEALLKAYQHLDQLDNEAAFRSWLAQIGKRVCWQLKEKEALRPILQLSMLQEEGVEIAGNGPPLESHVAAEKMKALLEEALSGMARESREVFELRDLERLSGEETAKRLGITLASMKSRLHRARKQLRERMDEMLARN